MEHRIVDNVFFSNLFPLGWLSLKVRGYILLLFFVFFLLSCLFFKKKQTPLFWGLFFGLYSYFFINFFINYIDTWYYSIMYAILYLLIINFNFSNIIQKILLLILSIFIISLFFWKIL